MGSLFFNIVINDLKSATSKFDLVMYADDITLVSTLENFGDRNNAKEIEQNINKEVYKITTWLHSNKLRLNVSKSKFMIFFKHPKIIPELNISINNNQIEQVDEFNFLGITIDQSVTWVSHISISGVSNISALLYYRKSCADTYISTLYFTYYISF